MCGGVGAGASYSDVVKARGNMNKKTCYQIYHKMVKIGKMLEDEPPDFSGAAMSNKRPERIAIEKDSEG